MFKYEKTLEYPVNVRKKDIKMAKQLITQVGGADFKRDLHKRRRKKCNVSFLELEVKKIKSTVTALY